MNNNLDKKGDYLQQTNEPTNQVNSYNITSRTFVYKEKDSDSVFETNNENNINNNNAKLNQNSNRSTPNQRNSPIDNFQQEKSIASLRNNNNIDKKKMLRSIEEENDENEYYFQTRIRNSGYWGKVTLRKGTWLVILGAILISMSIIVIAVFWRWWYGPEVNMPCRVIGISLLCTGLFCVVFGMICNWVMYKDASYKHFIGAPPRWSSWLLLVSVISIILAADLMTIYYTYWHNRWVNTPLISISIIFFFFGPIFLVYSVYKNIKEMRLIKYGPPKKRKGDVEEGQQENDEENDEDDQNEANNNQRSDEDDLNEDEQVESNKNEQVAEKKSFRKKIS